jgi:peptidyl-prolyl cis-trans isomerase A (cyclophilin A)
VIKRIVSLAALAACLLPFPAAAASDKGVNVIIRTTAGNIVVRLATGRAPITTRNFLKLVDGHVYDRGAVFYRVLPPDSSGPANTPGVIQGGLGPGAPQRFKPIGVESTRTTGLHNRDGAISMARTQDPNSATTEFFICVGDDSYLDADKSQDGIGYAAFGKVIKGYDIVVKIQHSPSIGDRLQPPIRILGIRRA